MCALNAKETNGACKELFDRLVAKGKNKKLAVIAVANKLLKQVFGMVKNECLFDRNYYKKLALFICFYAQFVLKAGVLVCRGFQPISGRDNLCHLSSAFLSGLCVGCFIFFEALEKIF